MTLPEPDALLRALDLVPDDASAEPSGGMSGARIRCARTKDGRPVVVKATPHPGAEPPADVDRELAVYRDLAPEHGIPTPQLVTHRRGPDWSALVLAAHAPMPPAPAWSAEDWTSLARLLGRLHRTVREAPPLLHRPPVISRTAPEHLVAGAARLWSGPGDAARIREVVAAQDALLDTAAEGPCSLVHGDCHAANVLRGADGALLLVDWQSARSGPGTADLAFALTRAMPMGASVPREGAVQVYAEAAGIGHDAADRQITAHQILILLVLFPEFAGLLGSREVTRMRAGLDALLARWAQQAHRRRVGPLTDPPGMP